MAKRRGHGVVTSTRSRAAKLDRLPQPNILQGNLRESSSYQRERGKFVCLGRHPIVSRRRCQICSGDTNAV